MQMKPTNEIAETSSYVQSLTPKEYKAYNIAKSHLGSSFDIEKSRGFQKYKLENPQQTDSHTNESH
jgi:hypothetical protein